MIISLTRTHFNPLNGFQLFTNQDEKSVNPKDSECRCEKDTVVQLKYTGIWYGVKKELFIESVSERNKGIFTNKHHLLNVQDWELKTAQKIREREQKKNSTSLTLIIIIRVKCLPFSLHDPEVTERL